jgi:hypothetical protein
MTKEWNLSEKKERAKIKRLLNYQRKLGKKLDKERDKLLREKLT